jgi:hypothetical protein
VVPNPNPLPSPFSTFQALLQVAKNLFTHLGEFTVLLHSSYLGRRGGKAWPGTPVWSHPVLFFPDDVSVLLQEIITEARNLSNAEM